MMGKMLPKEPGSATWYAKTVVGPDYTNFTDNEMVVLDSKNCNYYTRIAGLSESFWGKQSDGEYTDAIRDLDWFVARLKERLFTTLGNNDKVPYTTKGIQIIECDCLAQLKEAENKGVAAEDSGWVTVPKIGDISPAYKSNRTLPDVKLGFVLAGAIHKINVVCTVTL
jgi:hypothetical protein